MSCASYSPQESLLFLSRDAPLLRFELPQIVWVAQGPGGVVPVSTEVLMGLRPTQGDEKRREAPVPTSDRILREAPPSDLSSRGADSLWRVGRGMNVR
jgi:hypothetical protein